MKQTLWEAAGLVIILAVVFIALELRDRKLARQEAAQRTRLANQLERLGIHPPTRR